MEFFVRFLLFVVLGPLGLLWCLNGLIGIDFTIANWAYISIGCTGVLALSRSSGSRP